jgi:putative peptide zinc metalloprotease protein
MDIPKPPSPPTAPPQPIKLPQLRNGVTVEFSDYDVDGKPQWVIHDTSRNKFFIIGWSEYELLQRWPIGDATQLVEAVLKETTLHVDLDDVENLLRFLAHNYLIQQTGYQIYKQAKEQKLFKKDNIFHWLISYYLFFKIPIAHPDKFLVRTKEVGEIVFSKYTAFFMLILAIVALYQLSTQWEQFTHTFPTVFTLQGLFFYFIAYTICKLFHELGHAYMCRSYGVPVPTLGIAFLVFWPVLYTDTTLSWSLDSKKRMRIALAGILVETYVTIIAALLWCNVHNVTIQAICYVTITINWMASVLINVSPFMRFDGYYVLADFIKMPNLQPRAFALARWQIRNWLFHWPDPPPEKFSPPMHKFLVAYSIITWIYRLSVYLGIALLVYHFFIKIVGIILFAIELFVFILGPFYSEVQTWISSKEKFELNRRTKITLFLAVVLCFCFFLPINETIKFPGTLSYAHEFLIAPEDSLLMTPLPPVGTVVKANQTIARFRSLDLDNEMQKLQLEYNKALAELRGASINVKYLSHKSVLISDLSKQQSAYKKLYKQRQKLSLSVPFDGIVKDIDPDLSPGTFVSKDEWLGDVVNPKIIEVEGFVSLIDVNNLKTGMKGYFYPHDITAPAVPVKVRSIEVVNANKLACHYSTAIIQDKKNDKVVETQCYNASDLGGDVASFYTDEGEYVPVDSVFRVALSTNKPIEISHIERGTVVIDSTPNSFAYRVFYSIKTGFVKQSSF